jgi:hypothetical protein
VDKKTFIKLMQELIQLQRLERDCQRVFKKLDPGFNFWTLGKYENIVVEALGASLNDKDDWIAYWLYELNCGKNAKNGTVKDKNGKNIPIKTLSDLYDLMRRK